MLNYIKSECYRTSRGKSLYRAMGILAGLVLLMNVGLALGQHYIPDFRYGTFRFSLNNYTAMTYITVLFGAIIPGCLFTDDRRNGVLKNVVAYGISREKIFLGKCIVAFLFTFLVFCTTLLVYVGSAWLLLKNPEWLPLREMLTGAAASLPSATASLIFLLLLGLLYEKEMTAILWWASIFYVIPAVCAVIGLKLELFARIASWMPYNFLQSEAIVTYSDYQCLWDTSAGFAKCMIAGAIGIVVFLVLGIWRFRKQEL